MRIVCAAWRMTLYVGFAFDATNPFLLLLLLIRIDCFVCAYICLQGIYLCPAWGETHTHTHARSSHTGLGMEDARRYEGALLEKLEILRPGFSRFRSVGLICVMRRVQEHL